MQLYFCLFFLPLQEKVSVTRLYLNKSISFRFQESPVRWSTRWDHYLEMGNVQIHWFAIVNSIVIVLFLTGIIINENNIRNLSSNVPISTSFRYVFGISF